MQTLASYWQHLSKEDREGFLELLEDHGYYRDVHMGNLMFVPVDDILSLLKRMPGTRRFRELRERCAPADMLNAVCDLDRVWYTKMMSILSPLPPIWKDIYNLS